MPHATTEAVKPSLPSFGEIQVSTEVNVIDRGAVPLEPPTTKPYGVRAAYFRGPGALRCEIEGPVPGSLTGSQDTVEG